MFRQPFGGDKRGGRALEKKSCRKGISPPK